MVQELSHMHHKLIYILFFSNNFSIFPYNFQWWRKYPLKNYYYYSFSSIILIIYFLCSSTEFQVKVKYSKGVFYCFQYFWGLKFTIFASWRNAFAVWFSLCFQNTKVQKKIQTFTFHLQ